MQKQRLEQFDPVRFKIITSLITRAKTSRDSVSQAIALRATQMIAQYQSDFEKSQKKSSDTVNHLSAEFPPIAEKLAKLFSDCQFRSIAQMANQFERNNKNSTIAKLNSVFINAYCKNETQDETPMNFEMQLHQQTQTLLSQLNEPERITAEQQTLGHEKPRPSRPQELKSAQHFRESWIKLKANNLVSQAQKERPEAPGPLNAQNLVIQSLTKMKALSSEYSTRLMTYLDTLLWLEQAGNTLSTSGQKNTPKKTAP